MAAVHHSSTMTTMSMTKASTASEATEDKEETLEETIHKMKSNLIRYARSNDRRMVLRSLQDVKLLQCLLLDVAQPSDGPVFDLEKEVAEESIILNGVSFRSVRLGTTPGLKDSVSAGMKKSCVPLLKGVCRDLCSRNSVSASSREIYEKLIVRLAKTTSSADPYFRLNSLLGSPDLLVMPMDSPMSPSAATEGSNDKGQAVEVNLYESHGDIHLILTQTYKFGLLRKTDVKSNRPWIVVDGLVNERANLSTNQSVRQLKVQLPKVY